MKTFCATLAIGLFLGFSLSADAAGNETSPPVNFYLFSNQEKMITDEFLKRTPEEFRNHPDLGTLPAGSPCKDCYEDVSKRQADARYYISKGSNGSHFFKQQSVGAINYRDDNGQWREINPRLQLPVLPGEFHASRQPNPVVIDMNGKFSSIESNGYKIEFNKVLELFHLDNQRNLTSLGTPDWSDYTAGDEGVKIHNFYPGIDLEFIVYEGKLKTNIVLNSKLNYADGWLVMKQQFNLPAGLKMDGSVAMLDERGKLKGEVPIVNESGLPIFAIHGSVIYDNNQSSQSRMIASSDFNNRNQFFVYVPCKWLASPSLVYPVTIDPLVTSSQSMVQATIQGSGYTNSCYSGGCTYSMPSIAVPSSCTVTDVTTTFSYMAGNMCYMKDGGIVIHYDSCRAPSVMAFLNPIDISGNATISASLLPYIRTCIPAPQCATYNMDFSMDFYRCKDNQSGCNSNCISANSPWVITVEGHTVEIESITPDHIVCTGASTSLTATANYGVGPYTYSWTPGGAGQTISVAPASTQVYTCTVTDACGEIADRTTTATVTASAPPSVSISPSGTVCAGNNLTFTATPNNGGSVPNYDWYIGTISQQSGPSSTYTTTLNSLDSISVQMTSNSPCAIPTIASTGLVTSSTPASAVALTSFPSLGPFCIGETVTFTATPINGGPSPLYGWANGLSQSGIFLWTTNNSFSYIVQSGTKSFRAWMVSSLPCVTNDTVGSSTRSIVGTAPAQPNISIAQLPTGPVCQGTIVQFFTINSGGGSLPTFAWYLNGIPIPGATSATYSTLAIANGDVVSVVLTSNATCPLTPTDTASATLTVVAPLIPSVTIAQVPGNPLCPDECVLFSATPTNGGGNPPFLWKLNGTNVGTNSSIFSSCSLSDGDSVSVSMTASGCVMPSMVSAHATVSVVFIDTTATLSGVTLTSNEQGATYQWLQCDSGYAPISGATGQSYTAVVNGSYAVFITKSGCSDTSGCYPILNVGIDPVSGPEHLHVYPNPTQESVTLRSDAFPDGNYEIRFFDVLGKEILSHSLVVKQRQLDALFSLKDAAPGFYFLSITSESYQRIIKIMKQ